MRRSDHPSRPSARICCCCKFYSGELGVQIARYVRSIGGVLSAEDMAGYSSRVEPALVVTYRGCPVFTPPRRRANWISSQLSSLAPKRIMKHG